MEQRLTLITLGVLDLKRSARFYLEGLGWEATQDSSKYIIFIKMNGFFLSLYPHDELASDATVQENRSSFRGFTLAYNVSYRSQVDEVLDFAKKAGAKIIKPGQIAKWGGYSGYFSDPDGFLWEVACGTSMDP
ncbi:MAG: VOC family protein [Candidatus Latescibacterota bacterium]|nr:VOC family protein [Candidatus Latescibacterota bacterium]